MANLYFEMALLLLIAFLAGFLVVWLFEFATSRNAANRNPTLSKD